MTTAVFDCVMLLQAAANSAGPAGACLSLVEDGSVRLFLSPHILDEVRDVFARPTTRKRFPQLTDGMAERFLLKITTLATLVFETPNAAELPRDRKDEPYLNLAAATQATFIVTRDKDLLDLMKDDEFRRDHPSLTIIVRLGFSGTFVSRSPRNWVMNEKRQTTSEPRCSGSRKA